MWDWRHPSGWAGTGPLMFAVPIWFIALLLWAPAAILLRSGILARRHALKGMCGKCNYNLAGLTPDAPCPECGVTRHPT
jgi:hypothetical protein